MMYVVFTDLDGTLLDHTTYSCDAAQPALNLLREKGYPLVFCTSKTRAELEVFLEEMGVRDPFISENGGAIFIPKGYFNFSFDYQKETDRYLVIELGTAYQTLRDVLKSVEKESGCKIIGFGDMTPEEIGLDCGLDCRSAELSKMREYDEAFKIEGGEECVDAVLKMIEDHGLSYTRGGRYYHIMGDCDKGKAVSILTDLFRRKSSDLKTIGIGDSSNDLPMLEAVDIPVIVKKPDGSYERQVPAGVLRALGAGPVGWNWAILEMLKG